MPLPGLPTIKKMVVGVNEIIYSMQQSFAVNMIILRQYIKGWFSQATEAEL